MQVDTILKPSWIIPVVPEGVVLENHFIATRFGRIAAVAPLSELPSFQAQNTVEFPGEVIFPGLVNLHSHAAMNLLRGAGPDLPLKDWLEKKIWPAEARHVGPAFVRDGSLLAGTEMLSAGITCTNDQYFFPLDAARGLLDSGMRCAVSAFFIGFPSAWAKTDEEYLEKARAVIEMMSWVPRGRVTVAPHAPYTVGDAPMRELARMSEEGGLPVHIHVAETAGEVESSLAQYGERPVARLKRLGIVTSRLIAVHSVHLDDSDIETLARAGASVCLCPSSNMKLASGIPRIKDIMDAGINIGIGTDGAASNDRLDMLAETRLAALLAKAGSGDPTAAPVHKMIYAATMGGAKALGWDKEIGSLEPGKAADMVSCRLEEVTSVPVGDPAAQLLHSAGRENVTHVWVNGVLVVKKQQNATLSGRIDPKDAIAMAKAWQNTLGL